MNTTPPLTDHQLDEIAGRAAGLYEYATGLDTAWQDEADQLAGTDVPALIAEIRRLQAQLGTREIPGPTGAPLPPKSAAYEQMERARAELDKGFTSQEWAVGRAVCPEGFSCASHPLTIFTLTKRGRLPVHRHEQYGFVCKGSGQKPTAPPLQLRTAADPAA